MSFITNVNTLVAYLGLLEKTVKLLDEKTLHALSQADPDLLTLLAEDLEKGTYHGKRKLDIDLALNAKDPTNEVAYDNVKILLASGIEIDAPISVSTVTDLVGPNKVPVTASVSYTQLRDAINQAINDHNTDPNNAGDISLQAINTFIDIHGDAIQPSTFRCVRVLDVPNGSSNIVKITLGVAAGSVADAKDPNPDYLWVDTTSSLQVLIDHLPEFIDHTKIWQQVNAKNPLPTTGTGFLSKDSASTIQWQAGSFIIDLGLIDLSQDLASNGIDPVNVKLGAFGLVTSSGLPHADYNIAEPVSIGSIVFVDSNNNFRILDDTFHSRVLIGTDTHPDPQRGMLAYDDTQQRLAIALPTNVAGKYAWVDASPALNAGDLSAILAPNGAIDVGALNTQATTPKQVNLFVTTYAGKKADLDNVITTVNRLDAEVAAIPSSTNLTALQTAMTQAQTDIGLLATSKVALAGDSMTGPLLVVNSGATPSDKEAVPYLFLKDNFLAKPTDVISASALLQFTSDPLNGNDAVRRSWVESELNTAKALMLPIDGSVAMTGPLTLSSAGEPATTADAVPKGWLLSEAAKYLTLAGSGQVLSGSLDLNSNNALTNLGDPVAAKDAANRQFVETTVNQKIRHVVDEHTGVLESARAINRDVLFIWDV